MDGATLESSAFMVYLPWFATASIGALAVALFLAMSSVRRLQDEVGELTDRATRTDQVLAQATDGALVIVHDANDADLESSEITCSRRLAVLLSLPQGEASGFDDVCAAFGEAAAQRLKEAVLGLLHLGEAFTLQVDVPGLSRVLIASGVRADEYTGGHMTSVVWFTNVSQEVERHEALTEELSVLQHDRSRYRAALDAVPVPIWLRDDDLGISFCNNAFAQAVGAETPLDARQHNLEIIKGADGREGRALAASARAAGAEREAREVVSMGGELHHFSVRETPLFPHGASAVMQSEVPELRGTVGVALDATKQYKAETNLTRHEEAHALVLERLGTAMAVFTADQRLQFYNTAFAHLWQLDSSWLESEPDYGTLLEVLRDRRQLPEVANFPEYKAQELAAFTDLLEPIEALMHLPGGTTLRRVVAPHPLGGLMLTYEDVTDTLVLERSYNTLIDVQAETLNHLQEAVAVFDENGVLCLSNAAFAVLWDLPKVRPQPGGAEASGAPLHFREVIDFQTHLLGEGLSREAFSASMAQTLHQRELQTGVLPHQTYGAVRWQAAPVADGGLVLSYATMPPEAVATPDADGVADMIADVVQSITGWGDVLAHGHYGEMNQRQQAYVDSIRDASAALDRLLAAIAETCAAADVPLPTEVIDVHVTLSKVLSTVREQAQRRSVDLHFDCLPDIGAQRLAPDGLRRLLMLVLDMSMAGVVASDAITLAAQRDHDGGLTVTVADTGAGWDIPMDAAKGDADMDQTAVRRFTVIRDYAAVQGWRFGLVTVPGEGTTVTLRCDRA